MRRGLALALATAVATCALTACAAQPTSPAGFTGQGSATASAPAPARPTRVRIPVLQVDSAVIDLGLQADGTMEVPPDAKDAGWYTDSPIPGQPGPAVLAAHVNWKGADGPFAHIDQLKAGDQVVVESAEGAAATFVVDKVETHSKDAFPAEAVYGDTDRPELRLVTCGGAFDPAAHSYESNVIVFAHMA